jgi:hypothetical protein
MQGGIPEKKFSFCQSNYPRASRWTNGLCSARGDGQLIRDGQPTLPLRSLSMLLRSLSLLLRSLFMLLRSLSLLLRSLSMLLRSLSLLLRSLSMLLRSLSLLLSSLFMLLRSLSLLLHSPSLLLRLSLPLCLPLPLRSLSLNTYVSTTPKAPFTSLTKF